MIITRIGPPHVVERMSLIVPEQDKTDWGKRRNMVEIRNTSFRRFLEAYTIEFHHALRSIPSLCSSDSRMIRHNIPMV